jgi:hypothetical protein
MDINQPTRSNEKLPLENKTFWIRKRTFCFRNWWIHQQKINVPLQKQIRFNYLSKSYFGRIFFVGSLKVVLGFLKFKIGIHIFVQLNFKTTNETKHNNYKIFYPSSCDILRMVHAVKFWILAVRLVVRFMYTKCYGS